MSIDAVWLPEQDDTVCAAETAWARAFFDAPQAHHAEVYVNFLDSDDARAAFARPTATTPTGGSPR